MGVYKTAKLQFLSMIAISRNTGEGRIKKCKRFFGSCVFLIKGLYVGFSSVFTEQLGSAVVYNGRKCFISNWAGSKHPTLSGVDGWYEERCDRTKIKNVFSLSEVSHRFCFGFSWYMNSWFQIDVQKIVDFDVRNKTPRKMN